MNSKGTQDSSEQDVSADVRAVYERLLARRTASPAFTAIGNAVREACGLLSTDSSIRTRELDRFIDSLRLRAASRVLDVGCGNGAPARSLVRSSGCRVIGLDLTPLRLNSARAAVEEAGLAARVSFLVANANAPLPFAPSTFDAAIVVDALIHVANQEHLLASVAESLRCGGRIAIISTTVRDLTAEDLARVQEAPGTWFGMSLEMLAARVQRAGFTLVAVEDRSSFLRQLHRARLTAMVERRAELDRELGADEAAALIGRQAALHDLSGQGRIGSGLIIAEKEIAASE